jgi:hypothetical protein
MPIKKASELDFTNKKIKMIIAGYAGIGKTTLALSAPKPLLFDIEGGIDRVEGLYRKDTLVVDTYEGLLKDLEEEDLSGYDSFIIDTGGKLLDLMKPYVIRENQQNGQKDGTLSIKGWGAVAQEFKRFHNVITEMKKHIIFIFHTKEESDGDAVRLRIAVEGSIKTKIWEDMDLGGFVEMQGKKRTIGFSNTERYYAKGTNGVTGTFDIPQLFEGSENNFLNNLFTTYIDTLQATTQELGEKKEVYDAAMKLKVLINSCTTLEQLNSMLDRVIKINHALTSERELKSHLMNKAKELGYKYDSNIKAFI